MAASSTVVRGNLTVIFSDNWGTSPENDRDLLDSVLKISVKVTEPTTAKFSDLKEHLTDNSGWAEILLALKFVGKRATKPTAPGA